MKDKLENFSWKWVTFGFAYAMIIMSILDIGLPTELANGKPMHDWIQSAHGIFTAGWGYFTVITTISVFSFGAFPWAISKKPLGILVSTLSAVLTIVLMIVLGSVLGAVLGSVLGAVPGFMLGFMLWVVLSVLLQNLGAGAKKTFHALAHNTRLAIAQDD